MISYSPYSPLTTSPRTGPKALPVSTKTSSSAAIGQSTLRLTLSTSCRSRLGEPSWKAKSDRNRNGPHRTHLLGDWPPHPSLRHRRRRSHRNAMVPKPRTQRKVSQQQSRLRHTDHEEY